MGTEHLEARGIEDYSMSTMGRRPSVNFNLPQRMRARAQKSGKTYYYYDTGARPRKEIPLGDDYALAVKKWSELEQANIQKQCQGITFRYAAEKYQKSRFFNEKAPRTQKDYEGQLSWIYKFFDDPPALLDAIKPVHIQQYLEWRGKTAPVRANRERALISTIWNFARSIDLTTMPNPCAGVKGYSESGRNIYIEDDVFQAVWGAADQPLRDALDLAYLTGQRPGDVLKMRETDIKDGHLLVTQGKTTQKLRIEITGKLKALLDRIGARKAGYKVRSLALVCTESGKQLGYWGMRSRFDNARGKAAENNPKLKAAIEAFQIRDLRAKAGTDKADSDDMHAAQKQLGHKSIKMTEHYIRARIGEKVSPTK